MCRGNHRRGPKTSVPGRAAWEISVPVWQPLQPETLGKEIGTDFAACQGVPCGPHASSPAPGQREQRPGVSSSPQVVGKVQAFLVPSLLSDPRVLAGKAEVPGLLLWGWGWGRGPGRASTQTSPSLELGGHDGRTVGAERGLNPKGLHGVDGRPRGLESGSGSGSGQLGQPPCHVLGRGGASRACRVHGAPFQEVLREKEAVQARLLHLPNAQRTGLFEASDAPKPGGPHGDCWPAVPGPPPYRARGLGPQLAPG